MSPAKRSLATVLFTDIVGSTERAAELRDAGWRDLQQEHDRFVRRELRRFGGHEVNTAGDSFLATFDRPARAIFCASAIREAVSELGLEIRAGVHMGEVEGTGRDLGGLALNIGARVAAEAGPGEILVSRSVHDALAGSAIDFEDRGVHRLKGVPGEWRLFAVNSMPVEAGEALPSRWGRLPLPRQRMWLGGAVAAAVLLGGLYVERREPVPDLTPEEALAADAAPGIAVLPFRVNEAALTQWREGMVDLLSVNLDGVPDLRAIDNRTVLARWIEAVPDTMRPDLATSLAVARRTAARYALLGTVVTAGTDLRLTADVYETRSGTKLGHAQVVGAPDSILALVDRLTMEVLRALSREGSVLADIDLAEVTTDSLAALKAYLNGESLYRRADFKGAAAAYERAIASDSLFALAWDRLFATCGWSSGSELCPRTPPGWPDEYLSRLPARRAEMVRADGAFDGGPIPWIEALQEMVRKYPDDPEAWYKLGDAYTHNGGWVLADRAEGDRALERAIALAPTTSAEPYIHLIEHAFADADSARIARLLDAYEHVTHGAAAGYDPDIFRLAFALGFGDPATRAKTRAALDTVPSSLLLVALNYLGNPRLRGATEGALRVALARPDNEDWWPTLLIHYGRGNLRAALDVTSGPVIRPAHRAAIGYRLHQIGLNLPPEELQRVLAAGAADTTAGLMYPSTYLLVGAYAAGRGQWDQYAMAVDRQWARARYWQAEGDALRARSHEGAARALEGYALWKRGQKAEAIRALEEAQRQIFGGLEPQRGQPWFGPNVTVRWWLGELMLEAGRLGEAERYFKSISADPFAALRLGKVYENLGEFEKARASYEYALLSWQDADPELQPRIQEARRVLARLPKSLRRESP